MTVRAAGVARPRQATASAALDVDELRAAVAFLGLTHRAVGAGELLCDDVDRAVDLMIAAMEGIKQRALFSPQSCAPENELRTIERLMSLLGTRTDEQIG